jgi:ETC complex I subunit-like protein
MQARIYRPAKSAMQSGQARSKNWVLEFEHDGSRDIDPIMGWTGSSDMSQEVRMEFPSKEKAVAFAKKCGISYEVYEPNERKIRPKSYADNFK